MSSLIASAREIPKAPYYVLATDRFMSGWGKSPNADNVVILPCESWEEAQIVLENTRARSEMRYARINSTKPRLRPWNTYSLFDRDDAAPWYTPGAWRD